MNHFKENMFSNPEKTRLLISAVPTEFGNYEYKMLFYKHTHYNLESRY